MNQLTVWNIGPYHNALIGVPMRLYLELDGEVIAKCFVESGFLHRGLEKSCESHSWTTALACASHLDAQTAPFGELVFCLAVEKILGLNISLRAQYIRIILSELTRLSAHLLYLVKVADSIGSQTIIHYILRDREKILDLFEILTGSRFGMNFLKIGGLREDVTEGFLEKVIEVCDLLQTRMKEYNDIFTYNSIYMKRASNLCVLSLSDIQKYGITGPNVRASGMSSDLRKGSPYCGYQSFDFIVPVQKNEKNKGGDTQARFILRLYEMIQSIDILRQVIYKLPPGDFQVSLPCSDWLIPPGESYIRIESSRGLLGCYILSNGTQTPGRVQFRVPSLSLLMAFPELLKNTRIEDLPLILASLDMSISEVDK